MAATLGNDMDGAIAALLSSRGTLQERRNHLLELFEKTAVPKRLPRTRRLYAVLLCMPCYGLGDAVFGTRLRDYLIEWYRGIMDVDIVTSNPALFARLGVTDVIGLKMRGSLDCRRFSAAELPRAHRRMEPDVIFVAPLTVDRAVSFTDVRALIPCSTPFNTYFFSEYNDRVRPEIDFNTGLGEGRMGLLFSRLKAGRYPRQIGPVGTPFALAYVATSQQSPQRCFLNFARMVAQKYLGVASEAGEFHIISADKVVSSLAKDSLRSLGEGYSKVAVKSKHADDDMEVRMQDETSTAPVLVLRGDVLPVDYRRMQTLIAHSVRDVLVTGDQSVTDVISTCPNGKTVWYQIMDWKQDFAKGLAKYTGNDALEHKSTSCGGLAYVDFTKTSCEVLRKWDFRVLGRKRLDTVVAHALFRRAHPEFAVEEDRLVRRPRA